MLSTVLTLIALIGFVAIIIAAAWLAIDARSRRRQTRPILRLNKHPRDITNLVYNPRVFRRPR